MRKTGKYILRFLGWLLAGIIILLVIAVLLIQTKPVKQKLAVIAGKQAAKVLNGKIQIGEIKGNFFTRIELENVLWTYQKDTTVFIKSFQLTYNLLPVLGGNSIVGSAKLIDPYCYLKQEKDSTWVLQQLIKKNEKNKAVETNTSGSFSFNLTEFELIDGWVKINSVDTIMPRSIKNINTELGLKYASKKQVLRLEHLSFQTLQPAFQVEKLAFNLRNDIQNIELENFYLKTSENRVEGQADYSKNSELGFSARLKSAPLYLNEFDFFIPKIKLPAHPKIDIDANTEENGLRVSVVVKDKNQNLEFNVYSENFDAYISDQVNNDLKYEIDGSLKKIDLAHWLGDPKLNYTINGDIKLVGTGINPKNSKVFLDARLEDCLVKDKSVDELLLTANLENGNLTGEAKGKGNFGEFTLISDIKNLQKHPSYKVTVLTRDLNIAHLAGNDSLHSEINLRLKIRGKEFNPETLLASADIMLEDSEVKGIEIDTVVGLLGYHKKNVNIDSLRIITQSTSTYVNGNYNFNGISNISLTSNFNGIKDFSSLIPVENLNAEGTINLDLDGRKESLNAQALIALKHVQLDSLNMERLIVEGSGILTPKDTAISATVHASNFFSGSFKLDSIGARIEYFIDSLVINGGLSGKDFGSEFAAQMVFDKVLDIRLHEWKTNYKDLYFELQKPPSQIRIDSTSYQISNFKMASGASDSAKYVKAEGRLSKSGLQNFKVELANVKIDTILKNFNNEIKAAGILNTIILVDGTADNPEINGSLEVGEAMYNGYRFTDFSSEFDLKNKKLKLNSLIVPQDSGRIELTGNLPFEARFDSMRFSINPKDSIQASVLINNFPMAIVQTLNVQEQIEGLLNGNVEVKGTVNEPDPNGKISLQNASVKIPEYGIDYHDIEFSIEFLNEVVRLDTFYIKSSDGDLQASGTVNFNSAFYRGDVSRSEIQIHFNTFNPFNHRQFNMQLSGNAGLKGKKGEVVFDGNLNVPEAEIYLPAILNMSDRISTSEMPEPILIQEMEKLKQLEDTLEVNYADTIKPKEFNFTYLDQFTGKLNITIPKNTWIKNNDMHIELSGDVQLIKNAEYFELFGTVDVVRGQYELLGKTFIIDEGTIAFQGGEEIMPRINITATYDFRNSERVSQELNITVSGTANKPEIEFTLDGSKINEGDALSYILFGKSMDELSLDQQENVSGSENLAGAAVSALLSSQVSNFLGENIDIDYIDIKSDADFDNATVVVGKYITNDLFVSYEQRFGEPDETHMAKYEVKLEYELFRFLFFQLNNSSNESGFDLIFKGISKN